MRVECEHCRALVEATWSVDGGVLRARCPACGESSRAAVTPTRAAPAVTGGRECPKCGLRPITGEACPRCGLAAARMDAWSEDASVSPALLAAWEACLAAWDDGAAHDRAASLALTVSEQPWLARRYRGVLRERPDDAIATARLARVGKIAQAAVLATASTPTVARFRRGSSVAVLLVLVLAVAGGIGFVLHLLGQKEADPASAPIPALPRRSPGDAPWQRSELRTPPPPPSAPSARPLPDRRVESGRPGE